MLTAAAKALRALLQAAWPTGALLLDPDDLTDFEKALGPPDSTAVVVRFYTPTAASAGSGMAGHHAHVDVCSRRAAIAMSEADKLLALIPRHARAPNGATQPRATPIREASYHRVHISFTLTTA